MQDNAAPQTAKYTKGYFKNQNIRVLEWPPQSPDLNPIENAWGIPELMMRKRQSEYNTNNELWTVLEDEAAKMNPILIKNLVKSIPK